MRILFRCWIFANLWKHKRSRKFSDNLYSVKISKVYELDLLFFSKFISVYYFSDIFMIFIFLYFIFKFYIICFICYLFIIWRLPSLSELTSIMFDMELTDLSSSSLDFFIFELTYLGSKASIYVIYLILLSSW